MIDLILVVFLVLMALWSIMSFDLLKGAIALAITSITISLVMFKFEAPLAAVFELSVCAGLITVVFISAISLTRPLDEPGAQERRKHHRRRYLLLPVLVIICAVLVWYLAKNNLDAFTMSVAAIGGNSESTFRSVFWNERIIDIFGQIVVILAGIFGVVILFKRFPGGREQKK
jgi:NADH-quinone oxidoreductase subunit J